MVYNKICNSIKNLNTINVDSVFHHSRQLKKIEKFYITHEDSNNLETLIVHFSAWWWGEGGEWVGVVKG